METFITEEFNTVILIISIISGICGSGIMLLGLGAYLFTKDDIGTKKKLYRLVALVGLIVAILSAIGIIAVYI